MCLCVSTRDTEHLSLNQHCLLLLCVRFSTPSDPFYFFPTKVLDFSDLMLYFSVDHMMHKDIILLYIYFLNSSTMDYITIYPTPI